MLLVWVALVYAQINSGLSRGARDPGTPPRALDAARFGGRPVWLRSDVAAWLAIPRASGRPRGIAGRAPARRGEGRTMPVASRER